MVNEKLMECITTIDKMADAMIEINHRFQKAKNDLSKSYEELIKNAKKTYSNKLKNIEENRITETQNVQLRCDHETREVNEKYDSIIAPVRVILNENEMSTILNDRRFNTHLTRSEINDIRSKTEEELERDIKQICTNFNIQPFSPGNDPDWYDMEVLINSLIVLDDNRNNYLKTLLETCHKLIECKNNECDELKQQLVDQYEEVVQKNKDDYIEATSLLEETFEKELLSLFSDYKKSDHIGKVSIGDISRIVEDQCTANYPNGILSTCFELYDGHKICAPVYADDDDDLSLCFICGGGAEEYAESAVQSVISTYINYIDNQQLYHFVDLTDNGVVFFPFLSLSAPMYDGKLITDEPSLLELLDELSIQMNNVAKELFVSGDVDESLFSHNTCNDSKLPIHFIICNGVSGNLSEECMSKLSSIIKNGPRYGIFSIIVVNKEGPIIISKKFHNIALKMNVFEIDNQGVRMIDSDSWITFNKQNIGKYVSTHDGN